jgi:hypothetical protein
LHRHKPGTDPGATSQGRRSSLGFCAATSVSLATEVQRNVSAAPHATHEDNIDIRAGAAPLVCGRTAPPVSLVAKTSALAMQDIRSVSGCVDGFRRGRDQPGHRTGLRHIDGAAALDLDDHRARTLRHEALGIRWDHPIVGGNKVPARLAFQAGISTAPFSAPRPHGIWESAMKAALAGSRSAAKAAANFALSSRRKPFRGGMIGGTGAPDAGFAMSVPTDSPASGGSCENRKGTFESWGA